MAQPQARRTEPADPQLLALKVPPHSVEAEQSLLGGLLLDNQAFDKIADLVSAEDFYRDDHRRLYRHLSKLIGEGKPADVVTVAESVEASEDKDRTGGPAYLGSLAQNTPSALNIRRYAELVRERAVQRRLAQVATEIAETALSPLGQGRLPAARRGGDAHPGGRRQGPARHAGLRADPAGARARVRAHRPPVPPGEQVRRHRRADRLHRPGRTDRGPAARRTGDRRRPPLDGQDGARAEFRRARRGQERHPGGDLQHGNGRDPAGDAPARLDRQGGPAQDAHRAPERRGVEPAVVGDGRPAQRADLHRRDGRAEFARAAHARAPHAPPVAASSAWWWSTTCS